MTDEKQPPRLTTAQYADLLSQGKNPTVHDAEGNFIGQKPIIDQIEDRELKKTKKPENWEVERAKLDKLGRESYMTMLNVATLKGLGIAVERIRDRMHEAWAVEKFRRDTEVVTAWKEIRVLTGDYWQAEFRARHRYEMAAQFLDIIHEMEEEHGSQGSKPAQGNTSSIDGNRLVNTMGPSSQTQPSDTGGTGRGSTSTPGTIQGRDSSSQDTDR